MLPPYYQICFQRQLKNTEYLTLTILVFLLQTHKQVSIEALATLMPYPILFEIHGVDRNISQVTNSHIQNL